MVSITFSTAAITISSSSSSAEMLTADVDRAFALSSVSGSGHRSRNWTGSDSSSTDWLPARDWSAVLATVSDWILSSSGWLVSSWDWLRGSSLSDWSVVDVDKLGFDWLTGWAGSGCSSSLSSAPSTLWNYEWMKMKWMNECRGNKWMDAEEMKNVSGAYNKNKLPDLDPYHWVWHLKKMLTCEMGSSLTSLPPHPGIKKEQLK